MGYWMGDDNFGASQSWLRIRCIEALKQWIPRKTHRRRRGSPFSCSSLLSPGIPTGFINGFAICFGEYFLPPGSTAEIGWASSSHVQHVQATKWSRSNIILRAGTTHVRASKIDVLTGPHAPPDDGRDCLSAAARSLCAIDDFAYTHQNNLDLSSLSQGRRLFLEMTGRDAIESVLS